MLLRRYRCYRPELLPVTYRAPVLQAHPDPFVRLCPLVRLGYPLHPYRVRIMAGPAEYLARAGFKRHDVLPLRFPYLFSYFGRRFYHVIRHSAVREDDTAHPVEVRAVAPYA